jgi:hypothetical protein
MGAISQHDVLIIPSGVNNANEENNQKNQRKPAIPFAVIAQNLLLAFNDVSQFVNLPDLYQYHGNQDDAE